MLVPLEMSAKILATHLFRSKKNLDGVVGVDMQLLDPRRLPVAPYRPRPLQTDHRNLSQRFRQLWQHSWVRYIRLY